MDLNDVSTINLYCDGACEPVNPGGVASYGWIIYERNQEGLNGRCLGSGKKVVADGPQATNNYAEYCGLGFALRYLQDQGYRGSVYVYSDSKLLVNQVTKQWKCKKPHLQRLRTRIWQLADEMGLYCCTPHEKRTLEECGMAEANERWLVLQWIPRDRNQEADALSKQAYEEYQQLSGRSPRIPKRPKRKKTQQEFMLHCQNCGWQGTKDNVAYEIYSDIFQCPLCHTTDIVEGVDYE